MSGITVRCSRQKSTHADIPSLSLRACIITLALVNPSCVVHSHEPSPRRTNNNGEHTRNDSDLNMNNYCGKDWNDAYLTCWLACPNGTKDECSTLGEEYECQEYTLCNERIANDQIFPEDPMGGTGASVTDAPSKQPTPSQTALIAYPTCPGEYSSEAEYHLGSLVAYPMPDDIVVKGVYACQGENCNGNAPGESDDATIVTWKMVGSCDHSAATPAEPTSGGSSAAEPNQGTTVISSVASSNTTKWFSKSIEGIIQCAYGEDYPAAWMTNEVFREKYLFDSEEDCCAAFPEFRCVSTNTNGTAPIMATSPPSGLTPGVTPGQTPASPSPGTFLPASTEVPTSAPTETEGEESSFPTSSASFIHGQNIVFGITTIFIALLF